MSAVVNAAEEIKRMWIVSPSSMRASLWALPVQVIALGRLSRTAAASEPSLAFNHHHIVQEQHTRIMSYQVAEQIVHDRVNLLRLVRRLEKSIDNKEWLEDTREPSRAAWIKTQGVLQVSIKLADVYTLQS